MVGREIFDIEDVAHVVLFAREVDLVSIVVVAWEHLEGSIGSWLMFGLAFVGEPVLAKVQPHEVANVEYHGLLVEVELGRE